MGNVVSHFHFANGRGKIPYIASYWSGAALPPAGLECKYSHYLFFSSSSIQFFIEIKVKMLRLGVEVLLKPFL